MRNTRQSIPIGPGTTEVFNKDDLGGVRVHEMFVVCAADSLNALEYRVDDPADPAGEFDRLEIGEVTTVKSDRGIGIISARGVGGTATGGVAAKHVR